MNRQDETPPHACADIEPIEPIELSDFTATHRMVFLALIAVAIGIVAT